MDVPILNVRVPLSPYFGPDFDKDDSLLPWSSSTLIIKCILLCQLYLSSSLGRQSHLPLLKFEVPKVVLKLRNSELFSKSYSFFGNICPEKIFEALDICFESVPHANNHLDNIVLPIYFFCFLNPISLFFFPQLKRNLLLTIWNNRWVWLHPNLTINKKNFSVSLLIKAF